jgi:recombination protein RecT
MRTTNAETAIALIEKKDKQKGLSAALPEFMPVERFTRHAVTVLRDPELAECTPRSLIAAIFEAAQLGLYLENAIGHAYIVGFKNYDKELDRKVKEATLMLGFRGYIYLAKQTAGVNDVNPEVVYEGDEFDYAKGDSPYCRHKPTRDTDSRGNMTAAYSVIQFTNGLRSTTVMEWADIMAIKKRAPRSPKSPWNKPADVPAMAMKTVIRKQMKYAGLSVALTHYAVKDEYHDAGIPVPGRAAFLERMKDGQGIEPPKQVESESAPVEETKPAASGLPADERATLQRKHSSLSKQLRRKALSSAMLDDMTDNALVDAVEILRQQVQEQMPEGQEASPFEGM